MTANLFFPVIDYIPLGTDGRFGAISAVFLWILENYTIEWIDTDNKCDKGTYLLVSLMKSKQKNNCEYEGHHNCRQNWKLEWQVICKNATGVVLRKYSVLYLQSSILVCDMRVNFIMHTILYSKLVTFILNFICRNIYWFVAVNRHRTTRIALT